MSTMSTDEWWEELSQQEKEKVMNVSSPKKIILSNYNVAEDGYGVMTYRCPSCDRLLKSMFFKYCPQCGQKLNWRVK